MRSEPNFYFKRLSNDTNEAVLNYEYSENQTIIAKVVDLFLIVMSYT